MEHHAEMVSEMKVFGISYEKLASGIDFVDFCEDIIFFHRMFSAEMILYGEKKLVNYHSSNYYTVKI